MQKIATLIRNEFLREFDSPVSWVFFLLLPLVFTAAVGAGFSGVGGDDGAPQPFRANVAVWNQDAGELGQVLVNSLALHGIDPYLVAEWPEEASAILSIPPSFSQQFISGQEITLIARIPATSQGTAIEQMLQGAISRFNAAHAITTPALEQGRAWNLFSLDEETIHAERLLIDILNTNTQAPVISAVTWSGGADLGEATLTSATSAQQASAGQLVTWVQITLLGAAEVLVAERLMGTWNRLLITPTHGYVILIGKLLARLLLGLGQMTLLIAGGMLLFGVNWGDNLAAVVLVSVAFGIATVSLGMLVATFMRTRSQANSTVIGLSMGMAALGGAWYPLEITPPLYRQVVQILPSTWAMRAYTNLLARNADIAGVLPQVMVLLGFAVLFITLALLRFRRLR